MDSQSLSNIKRNLVKILEDETNCRMGVEKLKEKYNSEYKRKVDWTSCGFQCFTDFLLCMEDDLILENNIVRLRHSTSKEVKKNSLKGLNIESKYNSGNHHLMGNIYKSNNWIIKLGNIPEDAKKENLEQFLKPYKFLQLVLRKDVPWMFALVEMEDYEEACDMFTTLDGKKFMGNKLKIQFDRSCIAKNQNWQANDYPSKDSVRHKFRIFNGGDKFVGEGKHPTHGCILADGLCNQVHDKILDIKSNKCNEFQPINEKGIKSDECKEQSGLDLSSICMDFGQIEQMFTDTKVPILDGKILPFKLDLAVFEKVDSGFMWAVIFNSGVWANELEELTNMLEGLEGRTLSPALERTRRVCKKYDNMWNREIFSISKRPQITMYYSIAWIMKEISKEKVKLFFMDFGTVEEAWKSDLYLLPDEFWRFRPMALPFHCKDFMKGLLSPKGEYPQVLEMILKGKYNDYIFSVETLRDLSYD